MSTPDPLLTEIATLLDAPAGRDDPERLERTLTDGYARVLNLETEKSRLQRQMSEMSSAGDAAGAKLVDLARRVEAKDGSLDELRALLVRLRARHSVAARAAAR
jgi:hypothetical protein